MIVIKIKHVNIYKVNRAISDAKCLLTTIGTKIYQ